jgi:hypothetical protein
VYLLSLTVTQAQSYAQTIQTAVTELQNYFSNFLTVQTFGGDYMYQRLQGMSQLISVILADLQAATPNTADAKNQAVQLQSLNNDLLDYDSRFLTVQTFGGPYLSERLCTIRDAVAQLVTNL